MSDGLDDVVATHTVLSEVDGAAGRLVIRGHSLAELAGRTSFEEMAALMFDGLLSIDSGIWVYSDGWVPTFSLPLAELHHFFS